MREKKQLKSTIIILSLFFFGCTEKKTSFTHYIATPPIKKVDKLDSHPMFISPKRQNLDNLNSRLENSKEEIVFRQAIIDDFLETLKPILLQNNRKDIYDIIDIVQVRYNHHFFRNWEGEILGRNNDYFNYKKRKISPYYSLLHPDYDENATGISIYDGLWDKYFQLKIALFIKVVIHELHHSYYQVIKEDKSNKVKKYSALTFEEASQSNHDRTIFKEDVIKLVGYFMFSKEGKKWIKKMDNKNMKSFSRSVIKL